MEANLRRFRPGAELALATAVCWQSLIGGCAPPLPATDATKANAETGDPGLEPPVEPEDDRTLGLLSGLDPQADRSLQEGERAHFRGQHVEANAHFRAAQTRLPGHSAPWVGLIRVGLAQRGLRSDFGVAKGDAEVSQWLDQLEATDGATSFGPAMFLRAELALMLGDVGRAASPVNLLLQRFPDDPRAHDSSGVFFLARGQKQEALSHFSEAADLDPSSAARVTNLGAVLMMLERPEQAKEAYEVAVELAPSDARARSDLGVALLSLGQPRAALEQLEEAYRLAPKRATILGNLGYACFALGDLERAERWYAAALVVDPTLGSVWVNLGVMRAKQGRFDEAEQALQQALTLDPTDPRAVQNLEDLKEARLRPTD